MSFGLSARVSSRPYAAGLSPLYRIALGAVAVAMTILPLLYLGLTVLAVYGVYLFATQYFAAVWAWPLGMNRFTLVFKVVCSCTPLLVGGAIVVAMVKPIFAPRTRRMQPLALNPEMEPRVYAMVQEVCRTLGAPAPQLIELSCDLNAGAGWRNGWRGLFTGKLILNLGMPLVAGLSQRELAGVLAHEFGHFRQRAGMRVGFLIGTVNRWFARVVYQRDAWDEWIGDWGGGVNADSWWASFMIGCAQLGVAVSRGVLWLLMAAGHAISATLARQMEYDADRCQIRLAGSATLEATMLKIAALGAAYGDVHLEMRRSWRSRFRLPDNLPLLVEHRASRMDAARRAAHENCVGLQKARWWDTHPSDADRVRRARRLAEPGYEISDAPASELFDAFPGLCRLVTLAHYEDDLRVPITPGFVVGLDEWLVAEERQGPVVPVVSPEPEAPAVKKPIPMMAYDPSQFEGKRPPAAR